MLYSSLLAPDRNTILISETYTGTSQFLWTVHYKIFGVGMSGSAYFSFELWKHEQTPYFSQQIKLQSLN